MSETGFEAFMAQSHRTADVVGPLATRMLALGTRLSTSSDTTDQALQDQLKGLIQQCGTVLGMCKECRDAADLRGYNNLVKQYDLQLESLGLARDVLEGYVALDPSISYGATGPIGPN